MHCMINPTEIPVPLTMGFPLRISGSHTIKCSSISIPLRSGSAKYIPFSRKYSKYRPPDKQPSVVTSNPVDPLDVLITEDSLKPVRIGTIVVPTLDSETEKCLPALPTAGRRVVNKAGTVVGIHLRPHDLRRHTATFASRSGVQIEIVSKVFLRHANLSTTQRYLGSVNDIEAVRWIDNLYG